MFANPDFRHLVGDAAQQLVGGESRVSLTRSDLPQDHGKITDQGIHNRVNGPIKPRFAAKQAVKGNAPPGKR
ncbi:hypothetical protein [Lentzea atacamensis]|uniref:hypothetical protein n=1 Tax=Lentzea atacamensis TaxID=531938 RepID=UPI0011B3B36A|nr:hypothetical protein [Lentzea atacamensis]